MYSVGRDRSRCAGSNTCTCTTRRIAGDCTKTRSHRSVIDSILVFSDELQAPNSVLVAASPGLGLPRLQSVGFGGAGMGYGDYFAAAVVGAILAAERGPQRRATVALVLAALAWDQLFAFFDVLPATVPPAAVLIGAELWRRRVSAARPR